MAIELPPLPWAEDALGPHISAETIQYHYGKHHRGYVQKANELLEGHLLAQKSLEQIVKSSQGELFNNAAQAWNHDFLWRSMTPGGGGQPTGAIAAAIRESFGGYDRFRREFAQAAATQFGTGWAWLVQENGRLAVTKTGDADTPLAGRGKPLLTLDVWEHAYYIDYRNDRPRYIEAFLDHLINWEFAASNLK
jgi:Fe-Mn family superoxide dismutase